MYTPDLVKLIERHGLISPHLFADDTQVCCRCPPKGMSDLAARISACSDDILSWMRSNRLQLNADKTDLIWCATSRRLHRLQPTSIRVGSETISPSSTDRNLGVYIDSDLSMLSHVHPADGRGLLCCTTADTQSPPRWTLVVSLDYGNATLAGIPANLLRRLQAVLNAFARTITGLPCSAHSPVCTGFVRLSVSSSGWRRWLIVVYTAQPPATCPLN